MNDCKEKLMNHLETTIVMEPDRGLLLSGIRELSRGNEKEALETFTRALAGMGDASLEALCSARLLLIRRQPMEAVRVLQTLVAQKPALSEAHFLLARAYQDSGRMFDAVRSYRKSLALDPSDRRAALAIGELLDVQEP
jgi:predicted Zn-dependent protease